MKRRDNTLFELNKSTLLRHFSLTQPSSYHQESLARLGMLADEEFRAAAVMIGFVERPNGLHVLLTKRSNHLKHHPGQVSFPGGKFEPEDGNLTVTALRETYEELGIPSHKIEIFGKMPTLPTISRFRVTPYLAFFDPNYRLNIDKNEVALAFEIPASILLDQAQLLSAKFHIKNHVHRIFALTYDDHFIWGVTAQIIDALQRQLQFYPSKR